MNSFKVGLFPPPSPSNSLGSVSPNPPMLFQLSKYAAAAAVLMLLSLFAPTYGTKKRGKWEKSATQGGNGKWLSPLPLLSKPNTEK
jgi:hypothetical protein